MPLNALGSLADGRTVEMPLSGYTLPPFSCAGRVQELVIRDRGQTVFLKKAAQPFWFEKPTLYEDDEPKIVFDSIPLDGAEKRNIFR